MDIVQNFNVITLCGDLPRGSYRQWVLKGQIFNVGFCSLRTESTCLQHCVQLCTERQVWQGNCTVSVIATPLNNGSVKTSSSF